MIEAGNEESCIERDAKIRQLPRRTNPRNQDVDTCGVALSATRARVSKWKDDELTQAVVPGYLGAEPPTKSMSELDLLNLTRSCGQSIGSDFAQIITITFAMVVAIYYFMHQAGIRMKLFAFAIYTCGMLTYLGMILLESNVAVGGQEALRAIPQAAQSLPTQHYLSVRASWVGTLSTILLNLVFWVLWLGTAYLLFFWRRPARIVPPGAGGSTGRTGSDD